MLLTMPGTRGQVRELIADDRSPTVSGLRHLVDPVPAWAPPSRLRGILAAGSSQRMSWGGLATVLARAVLPGELLEDLPSSALGGERT